MKYTIFGTGVVGQTKCCESVEHNELRCDGESANGRRY
jgi:hypothetical protein